MKVNEIFYSIQGEGQFAGLPTIFIRFTGCNLRCSWCDTKYSYKEGREMTVEQIKKEIQKYNCQRICITGGEPLLQKDLLKLIQDLNSYEISIETNGSLSIANLPKNISVSLDIKCPSSGMSDKMYFDNLKNLKSKDQLKFIIKNEEDYEYAKKIILSNNLDGIKVFFNLVFGTSPSWLVEKILKDSLDVTLGLQFHKIIFGNRRGV